MVERESIDIPPFVRRSALLVGLLAAVMPFCVPLLMIVLPVVALVYVVHMIRKGTIVEENVVDMQPLLPNEGKKDKTQETSTVLRSSTPEKSGTVETGADHGDYGKEQEVEETNDMVDVDIKTQDLGNKTEQNKATLSSTRQTADRTADATANGSSSGHIQSAAAATTPITTTATTTTNNNAKVGGAAILAKLRAARKQGQQKTKTKKMVVLYGSQTGTAAEIAKNVSGSIEAAGLPSEALSMNEFGFKNINKDSTPYVIMVCSSTGDGEAPDNSSKFFVEVRKRSLPEGLLDGVAFTLLGLGDSNYTRFMHVPRVFKNRFLELGAKTFYEPVEADEVDGIEEIVEGWMEGLIPAVKAVMRPEEKQGNGPVERERNAILTPLPTCKIEIRWIEGDAKEQILNQEATPLGPSEARESYSAEEPYHACIQDATYLTSEDSRKERRVIHMTFDVSGSGIVYAPGDSIGVLPENQAALVDAVINRLQLDPEACFEVRHKSSDEANDPVTKPLQHIGWPCSVRRAFSHGVDITSPPRKSLLRMLAEYSPDAKDKDALLHFCSKDGREDYMKQVVETKLGLYDVLCNYPSCMPPLDALLDGLPALAPRMYSVSCSPSASPHHIQVAFSVVEYESNGQWKEGVATNWLERKAHGLLSGSDQKSSIRVPVFMRKGGVFSPPSDLSTPWILIGPGTGVAPFRGFLQHRQEAMKKTQDVVAECWLFFGCRDKAKDYIYGDDLEEFFKNGTITSLHVAESRKVPNQKTYVQHMMLQHQQEIYDMITSKNAYVFLCGDGANMARDVNDALIKILSKDSTDEKSSAENLLHQMTRDGRYIKDVWS